MTAHKPVKVVTIPAELYAELLDCRQQLVALNARRRAFKRVPQSPFERDREVAAFLKARFGNAFLSDILAECRKKFGPARTPSRSAGQRFWVRFRDRLPD